MWVQPTLWLSPLNELLGKVAEKSANLNGLAGDRHGKTAIKKGEGVFKEGSKWIADKDSHLSVWFDKWVNKGTLRSMLVGPLSKDEDHLLLKDVANLHGWNWDKLSSVIPKPLALDIKVTPIPLSAAGIDHISWSSSLSVEFDLKEAYKLACALEGHPFPGPHTAGCIWKTKIRRFL
ncbi:hypothetical protein SO802_008859 [Lithocarpus litseifolius]|uniref:Uncharacterized protein n=1 Tax=Lithocarpus litseifolius TaxID=425828 RepID=A0AAW2D9T1_9ROSI